MHFENVNAKKLNDLQEVVRALRAVHTLLHQPEVVTAKFRSLRVQELTRFKHVGGIVPDIEEPLDTLQNALDSQSNPKPGSCANYDEAQLAIAEYECKLQEELQHWHDTLHDPLISYVHKKYVSRSLLP